jgi:UDP:flavonoid glycosyltransferase YjiC (YdhE family)
VLCHPLHALPWSACTTPEKFADNVAAIGCELLRRGHDVLMAVAPDLVGFVESAGLAAVACGPDARMWQDLHRDFLTHLFLFRNFWKIQDLIRLGREDWQLLAQSWQEIG